MRGKVVIVMLKQIRIRITPAYAGKSPPIIVPEASIKDHPRLCGEKSVRVSLLAFAMGSPPPMRGKGLLMNSLSGQLRITPAYAGKSILHSKNPSNV